METLYAIIGFNLASTLFTLFEVIRLENAIDRMIQSISVASEQEEEENDTNTFM
jgi:hypothetical protein